MAIDKTRPTTYVSKNYVEQSGKRKWWTEPKEKACGEVFGTIRKIKSNWSPNYWDLIGHIRRYEDRSYGYLTDSSPYSKAISNQSLSFNVTASCIDTLTSKIIKNVPTVQYITNGADYEIQEKANDLQKFIDGKFRSEKIHEMLPWVFKDSCVFGDGWIHMRMKEDRVIYEQTKSYEIFVDWYDAMYGNPVDLHIVKWKNRYDIMLDYPEYKDEIMHCSTENNIFSATTQSEDNILIVESYNRYARRHTVCISNATLLDEDWELENIYGEFQFPLARMMYKPSDRNFFSIGLAEELKSIQFELNRVIRVFQRSSNLLSVPKIFAPRSANIVKSQLDNDIGGIIMYDGMQIPTSMPMGTIPPDLYQQIMMYYQKAYEIAGISQLTANSQKPAGLNSGKALETYYEIESDRFQLTGQSYENLVVSLNDITIGLTKIISKKYNLKSTYYSFDVQKDIDWDDVQLERDQFDIQVFPVNMMPNTPAGKFEFVTQLLQSQLIDPIYAKKLLRMPDTDGYLDLQNAEVDFVLCQISKMVRGEPQEPDMSQNFDLAQELVSKAYFLYNNKKLNPENLILFDAYLQAIQRLIVKKAAQTQNLLKQAMQQEAENTGATSYGSESSDTGIPSAVAGNITTDGGTPGIPQ